MASLSAASLSPAAAPASIGLCKFGAIQTRAPFWGGSATQGGFTFGNVFTAEGDFDYVRIVQPNSDPSNPSIISSASIAMSASLGDAANPVNASGVPDNTLWQPLYFNGGGSGGFPPTMPLAGTTRTISIPAGSKNPADAVANGADILANWVVSDWVAASSLPRIDGGSLPLIFTRVYGGSTFNCPVLGGAYGVTPVGGAAFDPFANGRIARATQYGGDGATAPGTLAPQLSIYCGVWGIQTLSRKRGLSIVCFGDSEFQGIGTISQNNNPFHIAASALSESSFPISFANGGYSGQSSLIFQGNAYGFLKICRPDVAFMKGQSPNDLNTYSAPVAFHFSLARCLAFAGFCLDNDIIPVLATAEPFGTNYTGAGETARLAFNDAIRAGGYLYVDFDAALSAGGSPAATIPGYISSTFPPHYNDAGSASVAISVKSVLQRIMLTRPNH